MTNRWRMGTVIELNAGMECMGQVKCAMVGDKLEGVGGMACVTRLPLSWVKQAFPNTGPI
jgi:hypothetical protein